MDYLTTKHTKNQFISRISLREQTKTLSLPERAPFQITRAPFQITRAQSIKVRAVVCDECALPLLLYGVAVGTTRSLCVRCGDELMGVAE